jgi:hypothetical protein
MTAEREELVQKKRREPVPWPFADVSLEAPGPWGGTSVPLTWDGRARAVVGACGPVARNAPIRLAAAGRAANQAAAAEAWLRQYGYANVTATPPLGR